MIFVIVALKLNDALSFVNVFPKISSFMFVLISPQSQIESQQNAVDFSLLFSRRRFLYGLRICWQAMQRGTEHKWDGFKGIHLENVLR